MEHRALLVAAYWPTKLTRRQVLRCSGFRSRLRIIVHLGPMLALRPRKRFAKDTVLMVYGTLVPTHDHTIAPPSRRLPLLHQPPGRHRRHPVVVGRPLHGNRNDCKAWEDSGAKATVGKTLTIADGG